ncbi:MAG: N-acetylglucosamine-6-phosphate deacetylase [bacterium]|nr:N-acetylglucosamine-6-phosphate deacetylase [bacterium]
MTDLLIFNARIMTPQQNLDRGWLICRDGRISAIGNGDPARKPDSTAINANGLTLLPGFIDIHTHGAMGHDVMHATPEALIGMSHFFARHGVTSFLATTWTDTTAHITNSLTTIKTMINHPDLGAHLLGVHLEGPYINEAYHGAQAREHIRHATKPEAREWLEMGIIKLISLAPEIPQNHWLIREAVAQGITVSVAHSDATYAQMQTAIMLGITHSTHTFNAMRPFHHRDAGVVGAVLESNQVVCELIPDGVHVDESAIRLLWMIKRPDKLILVTDSIHPAGMGDGDFVLDDKQVRVQNGIAHLADGTLAGGVMTMDEGLRRFMNAVREPLESVWQTTSLNPARAVHVAHRKGSIEIGKDADLVLMDSNMRVKKTLIMGRVVHEE